MTVSQKTLDFRIFRVQVNYILATVTFPICWWCKHTYEKCMDFPGEFFDLFAKLMSSPLSFKAILAASNVKKVTPSSKTAMFWVDEFPNFPRWDMLGSSLQITDFMLFLQAPCHAPKLFTTCPVKPPGTPSWLDSISEKSGGLNLKKRNTNGSK